MQVHLRDQGWDAVAEVDFAAVGTDSAETVVM
jgi:hypothetical protein